MSGAGERPRSGMAWIAARHSLGWLVAANFVGLWLSLLLLWPGLGDLFAPLTYGRWMPLHMNWQLYGWTALPVVGVLCVWLLDGRDLRAETHARLAFGAWSVALGLGGLSWLAGQVSGKLFLDWHGWARPLLPAAMLILWGVLVRHTWSRWPTLTRGERWARGGVLALLLPVPPVLYWSMGREVFPAVNPDSGGATGAALLGSTLALVTLFLALPDLLRVRRQSCVIRKEAIWALLAASWGVFALIDRGHTSHHAGSQIAALAVLIAWVPLLALHWRGYDWPAEARPWVRAACVWWALLVASGWVTFLPGVSEALKFTHGLVAHAHLAMAGLVTSVNAAILVTLARRAAPAGVFAWWQAGCAAQVAVLLGLGAVEVEHTAALFGSEGWTQAVFAVRALAGAAMTVASVRWLKDFWKP